MRGRCAPTVIEKGILGKRVALRHLEPMHDEGQEQNGLRRVLSRTDSTSENG